MSLIYIGAFPPKWGGVTVKNNDLFNELTAMGLTVKKIDIGKIKRGKSLVQCFSLLGALMGTDNRLIIGVSAASRRSFVRLLHFTNKKMMNRSIMLVMGGAAAREIASDQNDKKRMAEFKRIYVETKGMRDLLIENGMKNVSVYPNCRKKSLAGNCERKESEKLRCVFFSLIQRGKGIPDIIESAKRLPDVDFSFYGHVDKDYQYEFEHDIEKLPNCIYKGVFQGNEETKYKELSNYDVLLLPTKFDREGIPGVLVEAKIAGLSCIVSNVSYNAEIVQDHVNGIVLKRNDAACLTEAVRMLDENRTMLKKQKEESYRSADHYYLENYVESIIREIKA